MLPGRYGKALAASDTEKVTLLKVIRIPVFVIEHFPSAPVVHIPFPDAPLLQLPLTTAFETGAWDWL